MRIALTGNPNSGKTTMYNWENMNISLLQLAKDGIIFIIVDLQRLHKN